MKQVIYSVLVMAMAAGSASAGLISWGGATDVSTAADVLTSGGSVEAINGGGGGSVAVNGVNFTASGGSLLGGFSSGLFSGDTGDAGYNTLLDRVDFGGGSGVSTVSIGGGSLTIGETYQVQVWFTDDRAAADRVMTFGDGDGGGIGNSVNLAGSATETTGVPGQYAIGTFAATGTSQDLTMEPLGGSFGNSHIAAYQIRSVAGDATGTVTATGFANPDGIVEQHLFDSRTARAQRNDAGTASNERTFGQTFLAPETTVIDAISMMSANAKNFTGVTSSNLEIKVFNMNDGDDAGDPDSDNILLGTFSFDVSTLSYGANEWLRFDLGAEIQLVAGERYGFLVFWDSDDPQNTFDIRHTVDMGSTLAGGTFRTETSSYNDGAWTGTNPWVNNEPVVSDLTFVIHAIPTPAALPAGLALLGLVAARRRRPITHGL